MKTYKKGISLIVLVITVIVLAILATTVIISLSNTNIINEASKTVFKNDMASYKELYSFYLLDKLMEDATFNSSTLNVKSTDTEFTEIFGDNVKEAYKPNLIVMNGELLYYTTDSNEMSVLKELGMALIITPVSEIAVGDLVAYTPTANPQGSYQGATYIVDENDSDGDYYNSYIESTTNYTPGNMTWVYLGQDEDGNILLTSQDVTSFTMSIGDYVGYSTGPDRMDALCNTLYGNSQFGIARNMKIEDVNRVLEYNGPIGVYFNWGDATWDEGTGEEIYAYTEDEIVNGSNYYEYKGEDYKDSSTPEYKLIFKKSNWTANLPAYWLSSDFCYYIQGNDDYVTVSEYGLRSISEGNIGNVDNKLFDTMGCIIDRDPLSLRPVIVLNSNIQFGEKNEAGEWTLLKM